MSDIKTTKMSSFQRLLNAMVEPGKQMDIKALEAISARLSEVEDRLDYVQAIQEKSDADINGIGTTAAMLLKTMLRLTLQTQILYDKLGLDVQEEIRRSTSGAPPYDDEPGGTGGGMGGMLN